MGSPQALRASASGHDVTFFFCSDCGANLYWAPERMPHLIGVVVGGFADPDFPMPAQAVWDEARHAWLELPDEIVRHRRLPAPAGSAAPDKEPGATTN